MVATQWNNDATRFHAHLVKQLCNFVRPTMADSTNVPYRNIDTPKSAEVEQLIKNIDETIEWLYKNTNIEELLYKNTNINTKKRGRKITVDDIMQQLKLNEKQDKEQDKGLFRSVISIILERGGSHIDEFMAASKVSKNMGTTPQVGKNKHKI